MREEGNFEKPFNFMLDIADKYKDKSKHEKGVIYGLAATF